MNKEKLRLEGYCPNLRRKYIFYKQCQDNKRKNCEAVISCNNGPSNVTSRIDHYLVVQLVT